jgi:hypothetical protein
LGEVKLNLGSTLKNIKFYELYEEVLPNNMFNPIKKARKPHLRINTPNSNASNPNIDESKRSNVVTVPYELLVFPIYSS